MAKALCERYARGDAINGTNPARYLAVAAVSELPAGSDSEAHRIVQGFAVFVGQWWYFPALEPASAFGRSARMSTECSSYGLYPAARELRYCRSHGDEVVLLVNTSENLRGAVEDDAIARFALEIAREPKSSHWRGLS